MTELAEAVSAVRRAIVLTMVFSFFTTVMMLALPFYMTQVYTRVLPSRSIETLVVLSLMALVAFALYGLFDALRLTILARAGAAYEAHLSGPVIYVHLADGSRDPASSTEVIQDIRQVRSFISSRGLAAIAEAPFIPIFVILLFVIDASLGLLMTVGMVLMLLLALAQRQAMKTSIEDQNKSTRVAGRLLQSHVDQSEIVRVLGLQKTVLDRWGARNAEALISFVGMQTRSAVFGSLSRVFRFTLQAGILAVGAYLAIANGLSSIVIFACVMIGGRSLAPLDGLVGSWSSLANAWQAHKRVEECLLGLYVEPDKVELPEPKGNLVAERITYTAPGQNELILRQVSFACRSGESVGIVGPSGAGKSTLIRLLSGGIAPSSGIIRLDGADLRQWNRVQLGRYVGYVPQAVEFLPGTVAENIARFDSEMEDSEVVSAAQQAGVHEMILGFPYGYNTVLGRGFFTPSGGQKQLLAVARALYRSPKILFLDEPNSNLDQEGDKTLIAAINRARERGATVILVTQRPQLLQVVEKVLVLRGGQVESYGPRQDIAPKIVSAVDPHRHGKVIAARALSANGPGEVAAREAGGGEA